MARIRRPLGTISSNSISDNTAASEPAANTSKKRKSQASSPSSATTEPAPTSKKPRTSSRSTQTPSAATKSATTSNTDQNENPNSDPSILDVSDIAQTDENYSIILDCRDHPVPVFDTCDTIRRKIRSMLSSAHDPPITQAAFLRAIVKATYGPDSTKTIQSATLSSFMKKKGALAGNTSTVYYAAYCFFEKLRVKQKKPKSKDREMMEEIWAGEGGVDTKTVAGSVKVIGSASTGSHYYFDKYGRRRPCF
ncbi:hypothetical protein V8F20_008105 [Naviculisporaceae sp. PSN 640]